jgi:hypothetical protein
MGQRWSKRLRAAVEVVGASFIWLIVMRGKAMRTAPPMRNRASVMRNVRRILFIVIEACVFFYIPYSLPSFKFSSNVSRVSYSIL